MTCMGKKPYFIVFLSIIFIVLYLYFLVISLISLDKTIATKFLTVLLILINGFFIMHTLEYLYYYVRASSRYEQSVAYYFSRYFPFSTTVFIACYNEPVDVLENTIFSTMKIMERNTTKYGFFPMYVTLFQGCFCLLYCIQPASWNYPLS